MKAPHSLKNWLDCQNPKCPCNDYLAQKPPIPTNRSFTMQMRRNRFDYQPPKERPIAHIEDKPHGTAGTYSSGCRCVKCKDFNSKRMEKYRPPMRKRRVSRV